MRTFETTTKEFAEFLCKQCYPLMKGGEKLKEILLKDEEIEIKELPTTLSYLPGTLAKFYKYEYRFSKPIKIKENFKGWCGLAYIIITPGKIEIYH